MTLDKCCGCCDTAGVTTLALASQMTENGTEIGRSADVAAEGSIAAAPSPDTNGYENSVVLNMISCTFKEVKDLVHWSTNVLVSSCLGASSLRQDTCSTAQYLVFCVCRGGEHVTFKIVAIIAVLSAGVVLVASLIGVLRLVLATLMAAPDLCVLCDDAWNGECSEDTADSQLRPRSGSKVGFRVMLPLTIYPVSVVQGSRCGCAYGGGGSGGTSARRSGPGMRPTARCTSVHATLPR